MTHKARLAQLEKRTQPGTPQRLSDEMFVRSMDSLARVLSNATGETITGADAEKLIKELINEHSNTNNEP